ncbi:MAG: glycosyltransferase family 2 protein [Acidobacteriota bacterium]|nr:glycosyltransferase family 2 protein [Acidobacteriota bacterium]
MDISIILPIYNERDNLHRLAEKIREAMGKLGDTTWEAMCVNDGSVDDSGIILESIASDDPRFRPLHFKCNQGQTAAFDAGIRNAKGRLLVTMDADLQNDPADIPLLLEHLSDDIGAVCGVRVKRRDNFIRRISSRLANWVRNRLSGDNITDTGCSLKLFRAECFQNIRLFEGMHRFLPTLVKMEGFRIVEVPVSHHPRFAGESKYGVWNRLFKSFKDLLAVRWMKTRGLRYEIVPLKDAPGEQASRRRVVANPMVEQSPGTT